MAGKCYWPRTYSDENVETPDTDANANELNANESLQEIPASESFVSNSTVDLNSESTDLDSSAEEEQIFKSPLDPRKYKSLQLPNGLKVILISTVDVPSLSGSKNTTCHLGEILQFNKSTLGLDASVYKIRCECPTPGPALMDKATSTRVDEDGKKSLADDDSDESVSFKLVMGAIKALILGEVNNNPDEDETTLTTSILSSSAAEADDNQSDDSYTVEDDDTQSCTAYLAVGAGWFNDPEDMPGMAHFVEHCFFLGSKKFPYPNQLFRLILPNDGYTNAFTAGSQTTYTVSTSLAIYSEALEVLADGIGFPLLPRDLVSKEIDAVDSEFSLRQDDIPKYNQLLASLASAGHPLRNMDVGNKETLRIPQFYKKLVAWRTSHYCANYMTLALEAPLDLAQLEELAITHFSGIPSSPPDLPSPRKRIQIPGSPFHHKTFHRIYRVPSIYHSEFMAIHWALEPSIWKNLSVKPLEYLGQVISDKGEGGLYQFLNYFGWATNVSGGSWDSDIFSNQYTSIFTIHLDLTEEGFKQQDCVLQSLFGYLDMLKSHPPSQTFFQELQKQNADYFHHQAARESTSYAEDVALWLHNVSPKFVLVAPQLVTKFDTESITAATKLLTLDTCNVMVFSKKYREMDKMSSMESFYQTPYSSIEFSKELVESIVRIKPKLEKYFHLPHPNPYLYEITCCGTQPKNLIRNGPLMIVQGKCSVYYKDEKFTTLRGQFPQAKYVFWFGSPVMNTGRKSETMMDLFCNFVNEMIETKFSSALVAHFHIHAKVTPGKMELSLTGPSHQLPQVTKDVFKILIFFEKLLDQTTFHIGKQIYIERMDNVTLDNFVHAWEVMNFLWANHYQLSSEHIKQTEKIDYFAFLDFVKAFKKKIYIAGHLHGFITIEQAFYVVQTVSYLMKAYPKPVSPQEIQALRCPQLPIGESIVKIKSKNVRTHTSVVINGYQFGPLDEEDDNIVNFLAKCMSDNAYNQLRTLEQLGYIVSVYHDDLFSVTSMFIEVVTQPKNFSTEYCNQRMDQFVQEFYSTYLSDETKFREFIKGKPKVDANLTRIQTIYRRFLLPNSENYRKLSVQVVGNLVDTFILAQKMQIVQTPNLCSPAQCAPPKKGNRSYIGLGKTSCKKVRKTKRKKKKVNKSNLNLGEGPVSRFVSDIHEFKNGLKLYPNEEESSIRIGDYDNACSYYGGSMSGSI